MCYCKVFALLYFILFFNLMAISKYKPPRTYIWRGNLTEGFLRYAFGGLICGILRYQMAIYILSVYRASIISAVIIIIIIVVVIIAVYGIIVQPFTDAKYHKHNTQYTKHYIKAEFYCINGKR